MNFLLRRHMSFYIAAACGAAVFLICRIFSLSPAPVIAVNCFFILYLLMTFRALPHLSAAYLKKHAASTDEPVWIIFLVTFATVVSSITSLFILINQQQQQHDLFTFAATLAAVPLGWFTIHMMTALHYAHLYWEPDQDKSNSGNSGRSHKGGFEFPNTPEPSGYDFAYFAYVIGMTAQTSDTSVTTPAMRKVVLLHSIVSFFFNTVLVAAAVNVAVALGS